MKKIVFSGYSLFSTDVCDENIDVNNILLEFDNNTSKYNYTHYINNRWENIYLNPQDIPSVLPLLSFALSMALELFRDTLEPHETLIIPHELLGYEKNEFWFNSASKGESTRMHNHIEHAIVSGIFYLHVPENSANLFFKSANKSELEIKAETGKMIFFPSELDHYVPENNSSETRISLAFNCYKFPLSASALNGLPV